ERCTPAHQSTSVPANPSSLSTSLAPRRTGGSCPTRTVAVETLQRHRTHLTGAPLGPGRPLASTTWSSGPPRCTAALVVPETPAIPHQKSRSHLAPLES